MAIVVTGISVSMNAEQDDIYKKAIKKIKIENGDIEKIDIFKFSIDARKQNNILFVYSLYLELKTEKQENFLTEKYDFVTKKADYKIDVKYGEKKLENRPVIIGFGPAGMFCALILAQNNYRPIVLEKGEDVDNRVNTVNNFWENGVLDNNSNVQFGEGGAGTFSDGKLVTRISDPACQYVLKQLVEKGAPVEILKKSKPHIGTDKLRNIVKNIREEIIALGGEVRFLSSVDNLLIDNNRLKAVTVGNDIITSEVFILAVGHSARGIFNEIINKEVTTEVKPFSVGVRIEHRQSDINRSLFGENYNNELLGQGEYQLSYRVKDRAAYIFCMCPGGFVVPSSSNEGTVVVNGMSEFDRAQNNANSALVVSVNANDFGNNPKDAINYQLQLEQMAFKMAGSNYKAPCQDVKSFLDDRVGLNIKNIEPSYSIGVEKVNFNSIFSKGITDMMKKGLYNFSSKVKGFSNDDVILTGVETRTSSPIRILRGSNTLQSVNTKNLYPCGEGAGYAGGITSAGVDGIKIAIKIMEEYKPFSN